MSSLDQWLKRTCVCPHPDRFECARIIESRQIACNPGKPEQWDEEPCECSCHVQDYDDEE